MKNLELKKGILMLLVAAFAALFTACFDDASASGGGSGEEAESSLPAVEQPLVSLETRYNIVNVPYTLIKVQSQDNGTVIEKAVINRGNCVITSAYVKDRSKGKEYDEYSRNHLGKDNIFPGRVSDYFRLKDGKNEFIDSNGISASYYEKLDTESQAFFRPSMPTNPINFGDNYYISQSCPESKILEATLTVNGQDFTYKFEHY